MGGGGLHNGLWQEGSAHPKGTLFQQSTPTRLSPHPSLGIASLALGCKEAQAIFGQRGIRTPLDAYNERLAHGRLSPYRLRFQADKVKFLINFIKFKAYTKFVHNVHTTIEKLSVRNKAYCFYHPEIFVLKQKILNLNLNVQKMDHIHGQAKDIF